MRASDRKALLGLQHFFFDLDGTLADSEPDIIDSIEKAYRYLGFDYDASKLRIGPLLPDIIATISPQLNAEQRQMAIDAYKLFYAAGKYKGTTLFPGVKVFLNQLAEQGKTLYVATNKPKKPTCEVLETLGIKDLFFFIGTPDFEGGNLPKTEVLKSVVKMFDFDPATAVMVGDTCSDMEAGRYAGMHTLAFMGGYGGDSFLRGNGADFVIDSYHEVLSSPHG